MKIGDFSTFASWLVPLLLMIPAYGQNNLKCSAIGGVMSTDLAVVDQSTTLGVATGDLKGAVAAAVLNITSNPDGTVSFVVQHHLVTDSGDSIVFAQATAVTLPISATRYAILDYPVTITGGTGKYKKATGRLNSIGEVDTGTGQTVFRYTGKLCYPAAE